MPQKQYSSNKIKQSNECTWPVCPLYAEISCTLCKEVPVRNYQLQSFINGLVGTVPLSSGYCLRIMDWNDSEITKSKPHGV